MLRARQLRPRACAPVHLPARSIGPVQPPARPGESGAQGHTLPWSVSRCRATAI